MNRLSVSSLLVVFILSGCASQSALRPGNILTLQAEREVKKKAKRAEIERKLAAEERKVKEEQESKNLEELIAKSKSNPPEIALLELPSHFYEFVQVGKGVSRLSPAVGKNVPEGAVIWQSKDSDLSVMAWKIPLDSKKMLTLSRNQLLDELKKMGEEFDVFFQKTWGTRSTFKTKIKGSFATLKVTGKYLDSGVWYTQIHRIYFYTPGYRLNVMVAGTDENWAQKVQALESGIDQFETKLSQYFREGLPLLKD